jgi:hypothetical protein
VQLTLDLFPKKPDGAKEEQTMSTCISLSVMQPVTF